MTDASRKCQNCGTVASAPSEYCPQCGQLLMRIFGATSPEAMPVLLRTGDVGLDKSTTKMEGYDPQALGGQPLISRVGDVGLDRSHNEVHIQNVQGGRASHFPAKGTISQAVGPVRSDALDFPIYAGAGCHFKDLVLGLSTLHAETGVRFDRLVCILGQAEFKDGCQFSSDVICPGHVYLESAEIAGSLLAGRLRLGRSIVVHGDLICDSLEAVSDREIPAGTNITGAMRVRSKDRVRIGSEGGEQLTHIGALSAGGDVHIMGPATVGLVRAGGRVSIVGRVECRQIIAAGVRLEGNGSTVTTVVSSDGLEIMGTAAIDQIAVRGSLRVTGDLSLAMSGLYLATGALHFDKEIVLGNQRVSKQHVFAIDRDNTVVPANENNPGRLITFHLTRDLEAAIRSAMGARLTIKG